MNHQAGHSLAWAGGGLGWGSKTGTLFLFSPSFQPSPRKGGGVPMEESV